MAVIIKQIMVPEHSDCQYRTNQKTNYESYEKHAIPPNLSYLTAVEGFPGYLGSFPATQGLLPIGA